MLELQIMADSRRYSLSDFIHEETRKVYERTGRNPRSLVMSEESYNELMGYIAQGNDYTYRPTSPNFNHYPKFQEYYHAYQTNHRRIQFMSMNVIPVLVPGPFVLVG